MSRHRYKLLDLVRTEVLATTPLRACLMTQPVRVYGE
jgi:hypothetical protein